jgi:hypothetical protein
LGRFSDVPYFVLQRFFNNLTPHGYEYPSIGILRGGKSGIVAKNGYGVDLFLK